jgi:hypothetical protein
MLIKPKNQTDTVEYGSAEHGIHGPLTKIPKYVFVIVVLLIVVLAVAVFTAFAKSDSNQSKQPSVEITTGPSYKYSSLVDTELKGRLSTIDFKRPKEFTLKVGESGTSIAEYTHAGADNKHQLAQIGAASAYTSHPIIANDPVDLTKLADAFNSASGNDYQTYLNKAGITTFVNTELSKRYFDNKPASQFKTTINRPTKLTNANIKNNAWLFDFSSQYNDKKISGQVAFALGPSTDTLNSYYYLMLSTVDYNWQANSQVWHQVFDSMKIAEKSKS